MYQWLPNASLTNPARSPYGRSAGSPIAVPPAAIARWNAASTSGTYTWNAAGENGKSPSTPPSPIISIESPTRTSRCTPPALPLALNVSFASKTAVRKSRSPASRTRTYGVTVVKPSRIFVGSSTRVVIVVLRVRCASSRARNSALGACLSWAATTASGASSGSLSAAVASRRASRASMVWSRRSTSVSSAIAALQVLAQRLEGPQLQLLDGALRPVERRRDLANASLIHEPHLDDPALRVRQTIDELKQHRALLDLLSLASIGHVRRRLVRVPRCATPAIGQRIRGDPEQPGKKRDAAPLELAEVGQRVLEDLGRDVLGFGAARRASRNIRVDAVEMAFVEVREPRRIGLRRFNEGPLVVRARLHPSLESRSG